ncbi:sensor histidine kinase [Metabacillus sp. FJAT-53654]|uniref:histidine kinase n=1 Tax=Metabacillus rhizosphaerae TaxID=3117747 RepID=A0ABZ2MXH9_9BACI
MIRKRHDLFSKTQQMLTVKYSLLIILFLLLFIIILYSIVYIWFTTAEKNELRDTVQHEANLVETFLSMDYDNGPNDRRANPQFVTTDSDQLFYYVMNTRGELVLQNEQLPLLETEFITIISEWKPQREELQNEEIFINRKELMQNEEKNRFSTYGPKNQQLELLMIAKPIYDRNQLVGYLYIGQNITDLTNLLNGLFRILLISTLIFSGVAFYLSRVMSKRAMIPIEQAFKRQQVFVADASHELRTPLSVMLSSLDILEMEDQHQNEVSTKMVGNLKEEVKRMTGLVGDLLTLARSDSDDQKISFEVFDLVPISQRAIDSFEAHAHTKNIQLELKSPSSIQINGNIERLTQLLYILLDNAIKYSHDSSSISLSLWKESNLIFISVKDTGIGIDAKDLAHIFDRFYRVDKARTRHLGGHGLGLSIAKWIVDIHGGRINVESSVGEGSTFLVKIPYKDSL